MANLGQILDEEQNQPHRVIYKLNELADQAVLFCIQYAARTESKYGPQWELHIVHAAGSQIIWLAAVNKNGSPSRWTRIFERVDEWPAHSMRVDKKNGFIQLVACSDEPCPCQNEEVETIIAETLGDDAPASAEEVARLAKIYELILRRNPPPGPYTKKRIVELEQAALREQVRV
jgi:hypothetical protein